MDQSDVNLISSLMGTHTLSRIESKLENVIVVETALTKNKPYNVFLKILDFQQVVTYIGS